MTIRRYLLRDQTSLIDISIICAGSKQKMKMVGKQSPGITARLSLSDQLAQPLNKTVTIFTVIKYFSAANTPGNDVMQGAECIDACLAWHDCFYINVPGL
ncbi:MAG: hypothetical protein ABF291_12750 [Desulfobacterales bacterium]